MKIDLTRTIYRADETPRVREFEPQPGVQVLDWDAVKLQWVLVPGVPRSNLTLGDALRAVYASDKPGDTGEQKGKKGRLLKQVNRCMRKKADLELSVADAKFTLDVAGDVMETVVYIQIEDALEGRASLGDEEKDVEEEREDLAN